MYNRLEEKANESHDISMSRKALKKNYFEIFLKPY
jgi:hypothetical protein